ncbi:MAG: DUF1549 domain-containing protein [Verrucomicrobia bacterium]|nr:DUF1549 domain-containing protein [Verrucomicrobiota bacterium]
MSDAVCRQSQVRCVARRLRRVFAHGWLAGILAGCAMLAVAQAARKSGAATSTAAAPPAAKSRHWSFIPPVRHPPPTVKNRRWVRNPIDAFVLARLEREGVKPSPQADRPTLIRRLSLDLTGLPPTPAEVDAFVRDRRRDAYERLVDRLLASPHFGERWARHWLDLARYADSDGYEKDLFRPHAWRWRDWVIDSINRDEPYDQFTIEQIAGDLLPGATVEQVVATGFHRNTMLNREGGVDIEEDRVKGVVDRVNTVGTAWLGLTVGCAECHSHKFDPIPQREYYQLYAFFNNTDDRDIKAPLPTQMAGAERARNALDLAKRRYVSAPDPDLDAWARKIAALPVIWWVPRQQDYELPTFGANNGANLYPQEDGSFLVTGMVEGDTYYIMMLNTRLRGITGVRVEALADEMLPKLGPGWAADGSFVLSELLVESSPLSDVTHLQSNTVASAVADYSEPGWEVAKAIDGDDSTGWSAGIPQLAIAGLDRCAVFTLKQPIGFDGGTRLKVSLVQHGGPNYTLGRVRVSYTTADPAQLAAQAVPQRIRDIANIPTAQRTLDQQVTLKRYYEASFRPDSQALAEYSAAMADAPGVRGAIEAQAIEERAVPRVTHVHVRGNFLDPGPVVTPGTLSVLNPFQPRGARPDRLDLARWLVDPANPLTARVAVNHFWMHLFGQGLVITVADFGTQGDPPSHPELLDWLATEFIRQQWSRKAMIRLIVTSATYRQSSDERPELLSRDAKNRWLARQNRFRLSAEAVRDQYLAASGLLDARIGGPSVDVHIPRRGLYVKFMRAFPDSTLVTFDAPSATFSCPVRDRSDTPLQALTLLNDKLFVRCAQHLGDRMLTGQHGSATDRLRLAFRLCLGRDPTQEELGTLGELDARLEKIYQADPATAEQVAGPDRPAQAPAADAATCTVLARTILNLDEVITRE